MNHLIQRQILDVRLPNKQKAIEQQEAIRQLYWERIVPAMDQVFSRIVPKDVTLRIDELRLDIGMVSKENFEKEIIEQLTEQLNDIYFQAKYEQQTNVSASIQAKKKKSKIVAQQESHFKALIFFLENGLFPWWFKSANNASPNILLEKIILEKPQEIIHLFQSQNQNDNQNQIKIQKRLMVQFSVESLLTIVKIKNVRLSNILAKASSACLQIDMAKFSNKEKWKSAVQVSIKNAIIFILKKSETTSISTQKIGEIILSNISKQLQKPVGEIQFFLKNKIEQEQKTDFEILEKIFDLERKIKNQSNSNEGKILEKEIDKKEDISPSLILQNKANDTESKSDFSEQPLGSKTKSNTVQKETHKIIQAELEEGIYISNAGLALLAPFLPTYFEAVGLVKNQQFISIEAQERAILLTQYLVSDQTSISEHELIFNKIIMGWTLDEPLVSNIDLTKKEESETQKLLNSVLEHWGALGRSGIAALQETFLQREGKLINKDDQYKLIVERKSLDILMDKIPWSFSAVKLPWMEKRIQVEW